MRGLPLCLQIKLLRASSPSSNLDFNAREIVREALCIYVLWFWCIRTRTIFAAAQRGNNSTLLSPPGYIFILQWRLNAPLFADAGAYLFIQTDTRPFAAGHFVGGRRATHTHETGWSTRVRHLAN
jgi:hypothetical protein